MKIYFRSKSIQKVCEDSKNAVTKYGAARAKALQKRLADLRAVDHVGELTAGKPHPLINDRQGQFVVNLDRSSRLVFRSRMLSESLAPVNWTEVTEIEIMEIVDYHD